MELVNNILDTSKIEANEVIMEEVAFNLEEVICNIIATIFPRIINNVEFNSNLNDVPFNLIGARTKLMQVILNIMGNAIKFTKTGFVQIVVEELKNSQDSSS